MGLSFSIPIDVAMDIAQQLKTKGKVTRSYLGVMLQDIDRNLADAYNLPKPEGSLINQVTPGSPAAKVGLKAGDIIMKYNGNPISRTSELLNYLNRTMPKQVIQLEILRDGKPMNVSATLTTAPDDTPATSEKAAAQNGPVLGMAIRNLTTDEQARLDISGGIFVQDVTRGGLASRSNLMPGDVIVQINSTRINNTSEFARAVAALPKNSVARISLIRQGQRAMLGLRIN